VIAPPGAVLKLVTLPVPLLLLLVLLLLLAELPQLTRPTSTLDPSVVVRGLSFPVVADQLLLEESELPVLSLPLLLVLVSGKVVELPSVPGQQTV
jgi:hypothetical protein